MKLKLIKSPFESHNNSLFEFIKKSLIDSNIYDTTKDAFPYTDKVQKYQFELSGCHEQVLVTVNDQDYLKLSGDPLVDIPLYFWFQPFLGKNDIKIVSLDKTQLHCSFILKCYNIHSFLAFTGLKFKQLWNKVYQNIANKYYDLNVQGDIDEVDLTPSPRNTSAMGALLATSRYSGMTDAQYATFLHGVFEAHSYGGSLRGIYELQEIFPSYFTKVDIIPFELFYGHTEDIAKKLTITPPKTLTTYPAYTFLKPLSIWGLLPYQVFDADESWPAPPHIIDIYADGDILDGALELKSNEDPYFYKIEEEVEETVDLNSILIDTDGSLTGFEGETYIFLQRPLVDGTLVEVTSSGIVNVDSTARLLEDKNLNIVRLGFIVPITEIDPTGYIQTHITQLKIKYKTYNIPFKLGRITVENAGITNILKNQLDVYNDEVNGLSLGDDKNLSYLDNNYGSVVIIFRCLQQVDTELKNILNEIIKNLLPVHLAYKLVFEVAGVWDYWGQTDISIQDVDTNYPEITFADLM